MVYYGDELLGEEAQSIEQVRANLVFDLGAEALLFDQIVHCKLAKELTITDDG